MKPFKRNIWSNIARKSGPLDLVKDWWLWLFVLIVLVILLVG